MQQDTGNLLRDLLDELREQRENGLIMARDIEALKNDVSRGFSGIESRFTNDFVSKRELVELERKMAYFALGIIGSIAMALVTDWLKRAQ
ncbi:MAG: hypothetical protein [Caudoviricetes sp.]|nr:MAG: hypothetical protein [Caudoviricetes sp.]